MQGAYRRLAKNMMDEIDQAQAHDSSKEDETKHYVNIPLRLPKPHHKMMEEMMTERMHRIDEEILSTHKFVFDSRGSAKRYGRGHFYSALCELLVASDQDDCESVVADQVVFIDNLIVDYAVEKIYMKDHHPAERDYVTGDYVEDDERKFELQKLARLMVDLEEENDTAMSPFAMTRNNRERIKMHFAQLLIRVQKKCFKRKFLFESPGSLNFMFNCFVNLAIVELESKPYKKDFSIAVDECRKMMAILDAYVRERRIVKDYLLAGDTQKTN